MRPTNLFSTRGQNRKLTGLTLALATTLTFGATACNSAGDTDDTDVASSSEEATTSQDASEDSGTFTVSDAAGRTVELGAQPERIVFGEGRALFASSILNKTNPVDNVVAIGSDLHSAAPSFEEKLLEVNPEIGDLPTIGNIAKGDVTVENLVSLDPDVVVMTLDHKDAVEQSGFLEKMDQAGLKYVFTDFRQKPLENTPVSMEVFGKLLGQEDKAQEFNTFYNTKVDEITQRASDTKNTPRTLVWRAAGLKDCCATVKESNLGDLVNAAGGDNIGDTLLETPSGDLTAEKVVAEQPEAIIATGGAWAKDPEKPETLPHVELGYEADPDTAEATLEGLLRTPGFTALEAPSEGGLHAVYHQFYDSPFNVFALEQFAAWLHPDEFAGVDIDKDFAAFHREWLPFEYSGTFFVSDDPAVSKSDQVDER